jgi:hypothetical protein
MFHILFALWGACSHPEISVRVLAAPAGPPPPTLAPDMRVPFAVRSEVTLLPIGDVDGDHVPDLGLGRWWWGPELDKTPDQVLVGVAWLDGRLRAIDANDQRFIDAWDYAQSWPSIGPVDVDGDGTNDLVTRERQLRGCEAACAWDEPCVPGDTFGIRGPNDAPRDPRGATQCEPLIDTASPCEATCDGSFTRFFIAFGGRDEVATWDTPSTVHEHRVLDVDGDGAADLVIRRGDRLAWVPSRGGVFSGPPVGFAEVDGLLPGRDSDADPSWPLLDLAGDMNGDGYDDLVVHEAPQGDFVVIPGGAQGPSSTPLWRWLDVAAVPVSANMAVQALGDVNGDGDGDLSVVDAVSILDDVGALVYHGGPTGVSEVAIQTGWGSRPIGDFNGDGFDDVLSARGVYVGSPAGLSAVPWLSFDDVRSTVAVGDVDGDGRDDLARWDAAAGEILVWFGREVGDDRDGDGAPDAADCEPLRFDVFPGATETSGNSIDEDCDGQWLCKQDLDGDLHDGAYEALQGAPCEATERPSLGDCDDADPTRHRDAAEVVGNDVDEDCDGLLDLLCPRDADRDGYLNPNGGVELRAVTACPTPLGADDCDDADRSTYPGAPEAHPEAGDANCDGVVLCFTDADRDGWAGTLVTTTDPCSALTAQDCDDADAARHDGAMEIAGNDVDENCDGRFQCFTDGDGDGWTLTGTSTQPCSSQPAVAPNPGECDDNDPGVHPGAVEIAGNLADEDCDGLRASYVDRDGDGFGADVVEGRGSGTTYGNDCDDTDRAIGPGLPDAPGDAVDADCDGADPFHLTAGGRTLTVHGVPPRGRWWLAVSRAGPGPCVDVADGMCADLVLPTLAGDGSGAGTVRIPAGTVGYAQALARVDGVVWRTAVIAVGAP